MRYCILFIFLLLMNGANGAAFKGSIRPIPGWVRANMLKYTWHQGCPVAIRHLAYLKLSYWGFDSRPHVGFLIVHHSLAHEVVAIFKALYQNRIPIARLGLMENMRGDDNLAMKQNITTAFNCREVTGHPGIFSQHSYGRAIDLNPLINPYVSGKRVLPPEGIRCASRTDKAPGKITKHGLIYRIFTRYGWDWGGNWFDVQDYQHFEKRGHGRKRNPYGYR